MVRHRCISICAGLKKYREKGRWKQDVIGGELAPKAGMIVRMEVAGNEYQIRTAW